MPPQRGPLTRSVTSATSLYQPLCCSSCCNTDTACASLQQVTKMCTQSQGCLSRLFLSIAFLSLTHYSGCPTSRCLRNLLEAELSSADLWCPSSPSNLSKVRLWGVAAASLPETPHREHYQLLYRMTVAPLQRMTHQCRHCEQELPHHRTIPFHSPKHCLQAVILGRAALCCNQRSL